MTRVLFVGQQPETVDFSDPAVPPGFSAEKINAGITIGAAKIMERMAGRPLHDPADETAGHDDPRSWREDAKRLHSPRSQFSLAAHQIGQSQRIFASLDPRASH